jgi:hypothetical protein
VIYCVVPEELADELYDRLKAYYEDDPNVTVIIDRRKSSRRGTGMGNAGGKREIRDRRRMRVPGEFDPNVTVIVDRRKTSRRGPGSEPPGDNKREVRDRRRPRVAGEFPTIEAADT